MTLAKRSQAQDAAALSAISRLFSSGVIREMARKGASPIFARLMSESGLPRILPSETSVARAFDAAFSLLKREGCRDEYIYKAALTHRVLLGRHSLRTAAMLNEFRVGECKADIVILNGTSTVYEVKSERDSLLRLVRQTCAYSTVFAAVYVIAAEDHVDAVTSSVKREVGILTLNRRYQISTLREAAVRPERTSPAAIFDAIRTEEAAVILRELGFAVPVVPNTMLSSVLRESFVKLDPCKAHAGMVKILRKTRNLSPLARLIEQLPHSLQTAALSIPLRKADRRRLVTAMATRLNDAMNWA